MVQKSTKKNCNIPIKFKKVSGFKITNTIIFQKIKKNKKKLLTESPEDPLAPRGPGGPVGPYGSMKNMKI